jgi:spore germination protein YaaH
MIDDTLHRVAPILTRLGQLVSRYGLIGVSLWTLGDSLAAARSTREAEPSRPPVANWPKLRRSAARR